MWSEHKYAPFDFTDARSTEFGEVKATYQHLHGNSNHLHLSPGELEHAWRYRDAYTLARVRVAKPVVRGILRAMKKPPPAVQVDVDARWRTALEKLAQATSEPASRVLRCADEVRALIRSDATSAVVNTVRDPFGWLSEHSVRGLISRGVGITVPFDAPLGSGT